MTTKPGGENESFEGDAESPASADTAMHGTSRTMTDYSVDGDESNDAMVQTYNLRKTFKGHSYAVDDVAALTMRAGEIFCLLGHNGAGKSTLISILSGRTRPSCGDACVAGFSVREEIESVRERIAVCPQVHAIYRTER